MSTQSNAPERVVLSQELSEFLIEFSIALHRNAMYPAGHPALRQSAAEAVGHVGRLLEGRSSLSIGVARKQVVIEGVATDPRHPVLRQLAERLHGHYIGAITFQRGVETEEILDVLTLLSQEADTSELPLGLAYPELLRSWEGVRLFPLTFEQLELVGSEEEEEGEEGEPGFGGVRSGTGRRAESAQLWLGLARAAMAAEDADAEPESTEPALVARAIDEHPQAPAYDQVIVGYMLQIAEKLKAESPGSGSAGLRRRMSRLVESLSPETLARLLRMGGDVKQRRKFLLDAAEGLPVDAVLDLVQAAAASSQQTISNSMVRLLSKLSAFADTGGEARKTAADSALREQLQELVGDWRLEDPNPAGYTAALEKIARTPQVLPGVRTDHEPEPLRIVKMALELEVVGPAYERAATAVVETEPLSGIVELVSETPGGATAEVLWQRLATKENILRLLGKEPVDFETMNQILDRMDPGSVVTLLLDALNDADSRSTRLGLLERLAKLGPSIQPAVMGRLRDPRWYVQRNMLALLASVGCPPEFSAMPYAKHPEPSVRRESLGLAMRIPNERERAICLALADRDGRAFRIGVKALAEGRPPEAAIPLIANRLGDDSIPTDLRTTLVRALRGAHSPLALEGLLRLTVVGKTFFGRPRLAPRSPELLAAVATLADTWSREPRVRAMLKRARRSADAEIRAAAEKQADD